MSSLIEDLISLIAYIAIVLFALLLPIIIYGVVLFMILFIAISMLKMAGVIGLIAIL